MTGQRQRGSGEGTTAKRLLPDRLVTESEALANSLDAH